MAPELFGGDVRPTPQADIYALGVVIFEVREQEDGYRLFLCMQVAQVLTCRVPFPDLISVCRGILPDKPEDASSIGFSDPLWSLVRNCWDRDTGSRPEIGELVTCLGEAAANWDGLMPPCIQAQSV